jgi:hypothetical protein
VKRIYALIGELLDLGGVNVDVLIDGVGQFGAHAPHVLGGGVGVSRRAAVDGRQLRVGQRFEVGELRGNLVGEFALVVCGDFTWVVVGPCCVELFLQVADLLCGLFRFVRIVDGLQAAQPEANLQCEA